MYFLISLVSVSVVLIKEAALIQRVFVQVVANSTRVIQWVFVRVLGRAAVLQQRMWAIRLSYRHKMTCSKMTALHESFNYIMCFETL